MKKILLSLLILVSFVIHSHSQTTVNGKWRYFFLSVDSAFTPPRDTIASAPNGSFASKNGIAYMKNSGHWNSIINSELTVADGLSNTGSLTLGQDKYEVDSPALLHSDRYIPENGFGVHFVDGTRDIEFGFGAIFIRDTTAFPVGGQRQLDYFSDVMNGVGGAYYKLELLSNPSFILNDSTDGFQFKYGVGVLNIFGTTGGTPGVSVQDNITGKMGAMYASGFIMTNNLSQSVQINPDASVLIEGNTDGSTAPILTFQDDNTGNFGFISENQGALIMQSDFLTKLITPSGVWIQGTDGNASPLLQIFHNGDITGPQVSAVIAETWNTVQAPTLLKLNASITAAATNSMLLDIQVDNASVLNVNKFGALKFIAGGTTATGSAPITLAGGPFNTTPQTGAIEYNSTNLTFVRTGSTRENFFIGTTTTAASLTAGVGGSITHFYGSSIVNILGDPAQWLTVNINGTDYKIPAY